MDLWFVPALLVGGVVTLGAVAWGVRQARERDRVWREHASSRGLRFIEGVSGFLSAGTPQIVGRASQAIVCLDTFVVNHGKTSTMYTRARARFASGGGPPFAVYPEGLLSTLGKALGAQDVVLGGPTPVDDNFDEHLIVKCDDAEGTRLVWTAQAKALMLTEVALGRVDSDGETVTVVLVGALVDPVKLDALFELAGELASFGARELAVLAVLPDACFEEPTGSWESPTPPSLSVETSRGEVIASVLTRRGAPRLQLSIAHGRDVAPFSSDVRAGVAPGLARGFVPDGANALLAPIGEASLVGDDRKLRLTWSSVPAPGVVQAGVDLLAALADGKRSMGAFR